MNIPPLKCQGIKSKLLPSISSILNGNRFSRWVEPFCGSCVVALNVQPQKALLCDTNFHIIKLYTDIQTNKISPEKAFTFLTKQGEILSKSGADYYYEVRSRFNLNHCSLDFLFLNRSCFNGVIRFNRKGGFNVPFCKKNDRFRQAYITKICNQIKRFQEIISGRDWEFRCLDFRKTLQLVRSVDFIYSDPPYIGRHVDYYNSWSESDESFLLDFLSHTNVKFIHSTWHSNKYRENPCFINHWKDKRFNVILKKHFYHVGSSEDLRHSMNEALITNFECETSLTAALP